MTVKWDPSRYTDEYAAKVSELIEKKLSAVRSRPRRKWGRRSRAA